ncbi:hypothetical protein B0J15DRAFT_549606 [Fusarium solani]|uniref:Uncharacterized protein n=1 Tax=Fusarium solani TaxID=169388 RepID=A0A9P9HCB6_FUSSL|nr:uncharacterized protein B0J15DRAFT_549606 [Fusarium solani]KAH7255064.1 hypothetical protein B0J15DRAFT_549606 [Fusarium solani]
MSSSATTPAFRSRIGEFISAIEVIYQDDKPSGTVNEIGNSNADINAGHGGEYVWLKVHYASKPSELVSNIWFERRNSHIEGRDDDLAKGDEGQFRYFHLDNDMSEDKFVTEVALWRSGSHQDGLPEDWNGKTTDINDSRAGDFLYLVWKTKKYFGPKSP